MHRFHVENGKMFQSATTSPSSPTSFIVLCVNNIPLRSFWLIVSTAVLMLTIVSPAVIPATDQRQQTNRSVDQLVSSTTTGTVSPSPPPQWQPLFQLRHLSVDLAVVGRHIVGDVSVEVDQQPDIEVQIQWAIAVAMPHDQPEERMLPRVVSNDTDPSAVNSSLATAARPIQRPSYYTVPVVGDSWCSIQESTWEPVDSGRRHATSTLNCRRLPLIETNMAAVAPSPTEKGNSNNMKSLREPQVAPPPLAVMVKALDSSVQYQRHVYVTNDVTTVNAAADRRNCFDWRLPPTFTTRTRLVEDGSSVTLDFPIEFRCKSSSSAMNIKLTWVSDSTTEASEWIATVDPNVLLSIENFVGNNTENPCDMRLIDRLETGNYFDMNVSCRITSTESFGHQYLVSVEIRSVDMRRHSGSFSASFAFDEPWSESVSLFADLIVITSNSVNSKDLSRKFAEEDIRLRMRTCSDGSSGLWSFADTAVRELRLRQSVPDCVYCVAERPMLTRSATDFRPVSPAEVRIVRSDGLILGSEESHSFYWSRDPGGLAEVAALLLRSPTDEYNGEYICLASTAESRANMESSSLTGSNNRNKKDDNRSKRTNANRRSSAATAATADKFGSMSQIRFRINVQ